MLIPVITLAATGHINGCTNTNFDTNCCTKTFRITPRTGYRVVDVIVNGVSQGPITSYTFINITGPQTLKVIAELIDGSTGGNTGGGTTGGDTGGGTTTSGYKVKFNANGGTGSMPSQTFEEGTTAALNACTYTKTGFAFNGWALTADGAAVYADQTVISVTEETTLYATWLCTQCNGATKVDGTCPTCSGAKKVMCTSCHPDGSGKCVFCGGDGQTTQTCPSCNGKGYNSEKEHSSCDGYGCSSCNDTGYASCGTCGRDGYLNVSCGNCYGGMGSGKCNSCSGTGQKTCGTCSGTGTSKVDCPTC